MVGYTVYITNKTVRNRVFKTLHKFLQTCFYVKKHAQLMSLERTVDCRLEER